MAWLTVGHENSAAIELFYEDRGAGAPVVLVHGYPIPSDSWERQARALLQEGHRVITYDRRGSGRSSRPGCGYDWNTLADDLNVLMTTLDVHQAVIAGHSLGAGEILRYLRVYGSGRVMRAALIAPLGRFPWAAGDDALSGDRYALLSDILSDYYNADILLGSRVSAEVIRHSWDVSVSTAPQLARFLSSNLQPECFRDVEVAGVPVLIVFADADRIAPCEEGERWGFDRLTMWKSVRIAGAPHGLLWTHAAEVNAVLLDFIDG